MPAADCTGSSGRLHHRRMEDEKLCRLYGSWQSCNALIPTTDECGPHETSPVWGLFEGRRRPPTKSRADGCIRSLPSGMQCLVPRQTCQQSAAMPAYYRTWCKET